MSAAPSPVRLYVYFRLELGQAEAWRARWREAARQACAALPGLRIELSERPEQQMTWMECYRGSSPQQMADGEALLNRALAELGAERRREVFVQTFGAG